MKYLILLLFAGLLLGQNNSFPARGSENVDLKQDSETHSLIGITYEHHEVHSGSHYTFTLDSTVDDADTLGVLIVTPNNTKWAHLVFDVTAALDTHVGLYEASTHTAAGERAAFNNDRNSTDTCTTEIFNWTRGVSDGTEIYTSHFGIDAGVGAGRVTGGGGVRGASEWILKQNTKYFFAIVSATATNIVSMKLSWYEHTNK